MSDPDLDAIEAEPPEADVCIIMGSKSDLDVARKATKVLTALGVAFEIHVASAHRTPDHVETIVKGSPAKAFIAIAGLAAALPGAVAALTTRPVIGVPVSGKVNLDAILAIVQLPPGIPAGCVGLDRADNAAYLAAGIVGLVNEDVRRALEDDREKMRIRVLNDDVTVQAEYEVARTTGA